MNILAVDDEPLILKYMEEELHKAFLKDKITGVSEEDDAIKIIMNI